MAVMKVALTMCHYGKRSFSLAEMEAIRNDRK